MYGIKNYSKEQWALSSGFNQKAALLTKLSIFLNEKYPYLPSLFDLDMEGLNGNGCFG